MSNRRSEGNPALSNAEGVGSIFNAIFGLFCLMLARAIRYRSTRELTDFRSFPNFRASALLYAFKNDL
ncbi:MAG: hypothetical protein IPK68_02715 [Bdellovibrionales bacterium]|nr:hypothetical protein [Bdellovibrionales bacterium]